MVNNETLSRLLLEIFRAPTTEKIGPASEFWNEVLHNEVELVINAANIRAEQGRETQAEMAKAVHRVADALESIAEAFQNK